MEQFRKHLGFACYSAILNVPPLPYPLGQWITQTISSPLPHFHFLFEARLRCGHSLIRKLNPLYNYLSGRGKKMIPFMRPV